MYSSQDAAYKRSLFCEKHPVILHICDHLLSNSSLLSTWLHVYSTQQSFTCYINGYEASLTERGVLGFVNETICALSDNLQITEDIYTAFTPRCGLPLFNTSLAQPEGKKKALKSQQKLHTPFRYQVSMNDEFYELVLKMHFALWCNCFQKSCGLYKARESFEKLAFSVFALTQGVYLKFFSSTEPTCCASADWYLFWAETSDLAYLCSFWSCSFQRITQLRLGDLHPFESTTRFSHVKDL